MRPTWFAGGIVIAAVAGLATGGALTSAPEPAVAATSTIDVSPGGDINRAIDQARPGDSVFLRPGTYPGPVLVDKAITLTSQQASISAPSGGAAVIVTADGVTLDTIIATCESGSRATTGIQVRADQVRVITSTALGCERGILLDGAQDAYLQGDTLLGSHGRAGLTAGLWSTRADGLTMLGNTFEDNDAAMVIASTSTPALDSTTISGGGTGISLRAVTNAIIDDTLALDITGPAVTVTGSRGAEISRLNASGGGGGRGAGVEVTGDDGPSSVINVENSDLAGFSTGLLVAAHSLSDSVTVIGTDFAGVTNAAITVALNAGGDVDASIGNTFGGCGPRAPDHGYNGGGTLITDPGHVVSYQSRTCTVSSATAAPATAQPVPSSTSTGSPAQASPQGALGGGGSGGSDTSGSNPSGGSQGDGTHGGNGTTGVSIPAAIGSALVTVGVSVLLVACAAGVLYAVRRSRHAH